MARDIYTGRPIRTDSKEHIIPNFLGGKLQPAGLIDKETNDRLGSGIDAALDRALQSVRVLIDARSQRKPGNPAPTMKAVKGVDGARYVVEAGGTTSVRPHLSFREEEGQLLITGSVPDRKTLRRCARRPVEEFARKHGKDPEALMDAVLKMAKDNPKPPVPLSFPAELWTTDPYRATAKIACNLLAYHDKDLFLQDHFDPIRRFVFDGEQPPVPPVQAADVDPLDQGMGELDHLVVVEVRPTGEVVALVTYFGALSFVVSIGTVPGLEGFKRSYRVDQLGRADRLDDNYDLSLPVPDFMEAASRSYEEFHQLVQVQLHRLLPLVFKKQRDIQLDRAIEPILKAAAESGVLSHEEKVGLAQELSSAVMRVVEPQIREAGRRRHEAEMENLHGNGDLRGTSTEPAGEEER